MIEGLDGVGKSTLVRKLATMLSERGAKVADWSFPLYGTNPAADLAYAGLHGAAGDLGESVYGMAALFALDRYAARDALSRDLDEYDVVLVDRYVASNAAYGAARLKQDAEGEFVHWVQDVEFEQHDLPTPFLQVLLHAPVHIAASRAREREMLDHGKKRDDFESDHSLQERCAAVYDELAENSWISPWLIVDGMAAIDEAELSGRLLAGLP